MAWKVRIAVRLQTQAADIWKLGPTINLGDNTILKVRDGLLVYPDRRVKAFYLYAWDDAVTPDSNTANIQPLTVPPYQNAEIPAFLSETTNEAYAIVPEAIDLATL